MTDIANCTSRSRARTFKPKGELTYVRPTDERRFTNIVYLFVCSCGAPRKMTGAEYNQAVYPTCGKPECEEKRVDRARLPRGEAAWNRIIAHYQSSKWPLLFPREHAIELFQSPCYYCGRLPSKQTNTPGTNGHVVWNGIDRFDNTIGHTADNSVSCCEICNRMKGPMHGTDFLAFMRRIGLVRGISKSLSDKETTNYLEETAWALRPAKMRERNG